MSDLHEAIGEDVLEESADKGVRRERRGLLSAGDEADTILVAGVLDGAAASAKLSTEELLALIRSGESARDADLGDDSGDDAAGDDEMLPADTLGLDGSSRRSAQKGAVSA